MRAALAGRPVPTPAAAAVEAIRPRPPAGTRLYAVGDVHGRLDLLDGVIARIEADAARHPAEEATLVFVGDYVDRGPEAAGVIDRLIGLGRRHRTICLRGNHEALLLEFLARPGTLPSWAACGGLSTLLSYGLAPSLQPGAAEAEALAEGLRRAMPAEHRAFLDALPLCVTLGDFFFVHAGVRPPVPLAQQRAADMLWIRDPFLTYRGRFEKCIVHGHTPVARPEILPNRINLDTGAFATGRLSCVVLAAEGARVL